MNSSDTTPLSALIPGKDYRSNSAVPLHQDIIQYYKECYWDYRTSWMDANNLAIHYGYWDKDTQSHSQSLLHMNRLLADTAAIRSGQKILDAGCGVGGSSIWLAENFDVHVTGITLSPDQADMARANAKRRNVADRVEFQIADYCATPFPDAAFDVVWGLESVCYCLNKLEFIKEAYRLLKPGGCLVSADGFAVRRQYFDDEWRVIRICLDGWAIPNLAIPDDFNDYLIKVGFTDIAYRDISQQTFPSARRMYYTALLTYPMQKIMSWLRLRTPAQSGNFFTALNQYRIFRDHLACYGLFSANKPI
ncbi:MAG: methyltransferase domain-containing protein [Methylococcaceae bacterium]|nr:MAG: methyltransferase domain-containing protein [Methylococcaceae bacterium]